jgi:nucleotide-binding universal stress UspA family protein
MISLLDPIQIGDMHLPNRVIMSPLTRLRGTREHIPTQLMAEYYAQRAGAGLIISEGIPVVPQGVVMPEVHAFPSIPTKILLPIDFSPSSQAALEMAADLAQHFHAELFLLNVIPMFPTTSLPDLIPEATFIQQAREYSESNLAKCQAALGARGINASPSVEVGNDVAGKIMQVIEREHIDMVVISTHGISGWHPLIFGSIAEKVVKLVECPLLLLRSAKPESGVKTGTSRSKEWW